MNYLHIITRLRQIIRSLNIENKRLEKKFSISLPQLLCLQYLDQQPQLISSARDIKKFLKLNPSTVSGILQRLEVKGLVARLPKIADKRITRITLTANGEDLLNKALTPTFEILNRRAGSLEPGQMGELDKNIDLLVYLFDAAELQTTSHESLNDL